MKERREERPSQCSRGLAPPEKKGGQKTGGGCPPIHLLFLVDKSLLMLTLPHPTGSSVGRTNVEQTVTRGWRMLWDQS